MPGLCKLIPPFRFIESAGHTEFLKEFTMKLRILPLTLALTAVLAGTAQAQSLVQLYETAKGYDATYKAAQSQYQANLAKAEQAKALMRPTAGLGATVSETDFDNRTSTNVDARYGTRTATLSASQPLFRPANLAGYKQGLKQAGLAQAQLKAAEQDLIVRVSQAYFEVLTAQESLAFVKAQKSAVSEQLAAAKRNFEVGTSTITDTREAQARFDLVTAQEIAAENDLRVKKLALDQSVGTNNAQPLALKAGAALNAAAGEDAETWVQQATAQSPAIEQARVGLEVAQLETEKAKAGHMPTLDLNASYGGTRFRDVTHPHPGSTTTPARSAWRSTCLCTRATPPKTAFRKPFRWKKKPATTSTRRNAQWLKPHAPLSLACSRAWAKSKPLKRQKPPAKALSMPTSWVTKSACASTSMCSTAKASSSRPNAIWPKPVMTCCWGS